MKKFDVVMLCLMILLSALILIPLMICSEAIVSNLIEDYVNVGNEGFHSGTGQTFFVSQLFLTCWNVLMTLCGLVCTLIAALHRSESRKNVIAFVCISAAPFLSQILLIVLFNVVNQLF